MRHHPRLFWIPLTLALTAAACSGSSPTSPPSTPATVSPPTVTETFAGTLPVGSAKFYSFKTSLNGTVNVTLLSVSGTDVPTTVQLGVAIGAPSGTGCAGGSVTNVTPGTDPQVTGTYSPGRYCVNVSDVGNLAAPADFIVTIAYP